MEGAAGKEENLFQENREDFSSEKKSENAIPSFSLDSLSYSPFGDDYFGLGKSSNALTEENTKSQKTSIGDTHTSKRKNRKILEKKEKSLEPSQDQDNTEMQIAKQNNQRKLKISAVIVIVCAILAMLWILIDFFSGFSNSNADILEYKKKNGLFNLYNNAVLSQSNQNLNSQAADFRTADNDADANQPDSVRSTPVVYPKNTVRNVNLSIDDLRKQYNPDIIGELVIPGLLDEMVVQSAATQYYLSHNAHLNSDRSGCVFADINCSILVPPENMLLRGLASVPGERFYPFLLLLNQSNVALEPISIIKLSTLYEEEEYQLFAVLIASSDPASANYFDYALHPTFHSDEEMMDYVTRCKQRSLYTLNVDIQPQDRLLPLATITPDTASEGEVVLLYRMLRDEEMLNQ